MAIQITKLPFRTPPAGNVTCSVEYSINGGAFQLASNAVVVQPDGTLQAPFAVPGAYVGGDTVRVRCKSNCGAESVTKAIVVPYPYVLQHSFYENAGTNGSMLVSEDGAPIFSSSYTRTGTVTRQGQHTITVAPSMSTASNIVVLIRDETDNVELLSRTYAANTSVDFVVVPGHTYSISVEIIEPTTTTLPIQDLNTFYFTENGAEGDLTIWRNGAALFNLDPLASSNGMGNFNAFWDDVVQVRVRGPRTRLKVTNVTTGAVMVDNTQAGDQSYQYTIQRYYDYRIDTWVEAAPTTTTTTPAPTTTTTTPAPTTTTTTPAPTTTTTTPAPPPPPPPGDAHMQKGNYFVDYSEGNGIQGTCSIPGVRVGRSQQAADDSMAAGYTNTVDFRIATDNAAEEQYTVSFNPGDLYSNTVNVDNSAAGTCTTVVSDTIYVVY